MPNIPPPPPGFTLDTPNAAPSLGRPIIRKGVEPSAPPSGYRPTTSGLEYIPGGPADPNAAPPKKTEAPSGYRYRADGNLEIIPGGPADKTNDGDPLQAAVKGLGLDELLFNSKRARGQIKNTWATGPLGTVSGKSPFAGSDRADFLGTLQSLQGGIILEKLQALKDASKTGASGMGALSEKEGERLAAAVAAVNENMSGDELIKSLDVIDRHAKILQAIGSGANPDDPGVQKQFGILPLPGNGEENNNNGGITPPSGGPPPPSPNFTPSTDGTRSVVDPAKQALGGKIAALMSRGAGKGAILKFAATNDPTLKDDPRFLGWLDKALAARKQNPKARFGVDPSFYTTQVPLNAAEDVLNAAAQSGPGGAVAAYGAGAGNALTGGYLDEIAGLTGGDAQRAEQNKQFIRDEHPVADFLGQVTGGIMAGKGLSKLPVLGANPLAADIGFGSIYGSGESNDNRLGGALLGGASAYAGNKAMNALGKVASSFRGSRAARNAVGRDVFDAGQRLGVDVLPADVGGPMTRRLTGAAAQGPVSAIPIVKGAQRVTEQSKAARDTIVSGVGNALEPEAAGELAKQGADKFVKRTSQLGNNLYRRAEALAGNAQVALPRAVQALDQHIAELSQVPGGAEGLQALQQLRSELADKSFTVAGVRGMRTALRDKFIKDGLRGSDLERRVSGVIKAANEDLAQGLADQGLQNASGVYKQADRYWRMRLQTIDSTLQPIIGKNGEKSGEQVVQALETAAKGNNARLSGFLNALDPDEQTTIRATVISNLGKASKGTNNATGDAFSLPQFLTHWNAMTPGAKRTLFQGETRQALDDLAKVAEGTKAAQRYENHSNSAGGVVGQMFVGGVPLYAGGIPAATVALGAQYVTGRVLASPRFARWLVGAGRTSNPRAYVDKLQRIAAQEAPIAAELIGLRRALLSGANDNLATAPVAAGSDSNDRH